uniref:Uncharacterized protein n=1 Tax=Arundo donax TaxID=35708 RepID=A0A0A9HG44_ARUDO
MLSARALHISWGETPEYWRWIPLTDSTGSLKVLNSWMFAGWKYVARYIARCSRKTQLILLWTRFSGPGGIN